MKTWLLAGLAVAGCATTADDSSQTDEVGSTAYVDIFDFAGTNQDTWVGVRQKLAQEFGDVCGDTFCEGDYANLTPLTFTCSVTSKAGKVKDCSWTFAGSLAAVDSKTAAIAIDAPTFQCHVAPKTTAAKLTALLAGSPDAIHEILPGTSGSIYDALVDCFQHPIGKTPVTFSNDPAPTYIDANAYYTSAAGQTRWRTAQDDLALGFDRVCGDTFCGGDFGDLQALQFVCSVTKSTGNVKSCAWVFGGSYALVGAAGALAVTTQTWHCNVPVKGSLGQLITAVSTTDPVNDAIHRALPGGTATAYDALLACLP